MAYEDWTGWTEVDADSDLTVAANQITVATLTNDLACVYKLYGTNYFAGQFTHKIDFQITAESGSAPVDGIISWSDIAHWTFTDLSSGGVCIYGWAVAGSGSDALYIESSAASDGLNYNLLLNTTYYLTIVRNAANLITCFVYSNAARTTLLDSISITNTVAFDYLSCAWEGYDPSITWSGLLYNLDVGAAGGATYNESITVSSTPACSNSPKVDFFPSLGAFASTPALNRAVSADLLGAINLASTPALNRAAIADLLGNIGLASTPAASMIGGMDYSAALTLASSPAVSMAYLLSIFPSLVLSSNPALAASAIGNFFNSLTLAGTPAAVMAAIADLFASLALASSSAFAVLGGSDFYESLALSSFPAFSIAVFKATFGELTLTSNPALSVSALADLYAAVIMASAAGISLSALAELFAGLSLSSNPALSALGQIGGEIIQKMVAEILRLVSERTVIISKTHNPFVLSFKTRLQTEEVLV